MRTTKILCIFLAALFLAAPSVWAAERPEISWIETSVELIVNQILEIAVGMTSVLEIESSESASEEETPATVQSIEAEPLPSEEEILGHIEPIG